MNKMTKEFSEFALFSEEESRALDDRSVVREGQDKTYIKCLVRGGR